MRSVTKSAGSDGEAFIETLDELRKEGSVPGRCRPYVDTSQAVGTTPKREAASVTVCRPTRTSLKASIRFKSLVLILIRPILRNVSMTP
jgi:hypothetical protein